MQPIAALSLLLSLLSVATASPGGGGDYETAKAEAEALKLADSYTTHPAVEVREAEAEADSSLPAALGLEERTPKELQGRACRDNGCTCKKVKQGQYCGSCQQVITYGRGSDILDIFECNPKGGCCSYGPSKDCSTYAKGIKNCPR